MIAVAFRPLAEEDNQPQRTARGYGATKLEKRFHHKGHKGHKVKKFGFGIFTAKNAKGM